MIIKSIEVENFRCLKNAKLECSDLTILVGHNGVGKSTFLMALKAFYDPKAKFSPEDFYNRDASKNIVIQVTFGELTETEKEKFKSYLKPKSGELTVKKEIQWVIEKREAQQKYFGCIFQNQEFKDIRKATLPESRTLYSKFRQQDKYADLPDLGKSPTKEQILQALQEWEKAHPEALEPTPEEHQFFGYREVGEAYLEKYTRFVFIPAVKEASEEVVEAKSSAITQLLDLIIKAELENWDEFTTFKKETLKRYQELMESPTISTRAKRLQNDLDKKMRVFAPETNLRLNLIPPKEIDTISVPRADIKINELGYDTPVDRVGHGTQRAFIFSMLQQLAITERYGEGSETSTAPLDAHLIIGIEEPELYQHPSRQRAILKTLLKLTKGKSTGVVDRIQVICSTHSPLMLSPENFDQIRLIRREREDTNLPSVTKVYHYSVGEAATKWKEITGEECSPEKYRSKIRGCITPRLNEGFFSDLVVLVEGPTDEGIILGMASDMASAMGWELEERDIAVLPVNGKKNLLKLGIMFKGFGIPIYIIWDSDKNDKEKLQDHKKTNRGLLRFLGANDEEPFIEKVSNDFACFENNIEQSLKQEIGEEYDELIKMCEENEALENKQVLQNPYLMRRFFEKARKKGKSCEGFREIVRMIIKKRETKTESEKFDKLGER